MNSLQPTASKGIDHPSFDGPAAQEYTGMSPTQLDRARWEHKLSYFRIGNKVRYSQRQLDEYLESCRVNAGTE